MTDPIDMKAWKLQRSLESTLDYLSSGMQAIAPAAGAITGGLAAYLLGLKHDKIAIISFASGLFSMIAQQQYEIYRTARKQRNNAFYDFDSDDAA
jgi:hypothetical protein